MAAVQMRPAVPVHALFPQMQGAALLGAEPSVFVQAVVVVAVAVGIAIGGAVFNLI